jgi:NAD(P)H-nitrite reductase large subunit
MNIVIVGAGPAGVSAAETLRAQDPRVSITMISREPFPPYSPPLMAEYLLHGGDTIFWRGRDFAEKLNIRYLSPRTVVRVLPEQKQLQFADGEQLGYDRLIITTGSTLYAPIRNAIRQPHSEGPAGGFHHFKSLSAAQHIQQEIQSGRVKTAVVVGAGFIGTEIAITLNQLGVQVTLVEMENRVMPRMLDEDSSRLAQQFLEQMGIRILLDTEGVEFFGEHFAEGLLLKSGETLTADLMIAATGVRPNVDFLKASGFETHWGLLVNEYLQTNFPEVYAAGDCVEVPDRITGERYVHAIYPNAVEQGQIAARNALGEQVRYEGAYNMNSLKHLGIPIMAIGTVEGEETLSYWDGKEVLKKIYLTRGRITGVRLVGDIDNAGVYFSLMMRGTNVTSMKPYLLTRFFNLAYLMENARIS